MPDNIPANENKPELTETTDNNADVTTETTIITDNNPEFTTEAVVTTEKIEIQQPVEIDYTQLSSASEILESCKGKTFKEVVEIFGEPLRGTDLKSNDGNELYAQRHSFSYPINTLWIINGKLFEFQFGLPEDLNEDLSYNPESHVFDDFYSDLMAGYYAYAKEGHTAEEISHYFFEHWDEMRDRTVLNFAYGFTISPRDFLTESAYNKYFN